MSSDLDIAAQRLLGELAELSLAVARDLAAAIHESDDDGQMMGLTQAFAKVGRCLRMSLALAMRLGRGEALAPAAGNRDDRDLELETERDESDFIEERPERLDDRENLFDRLPSGDLDVQIATVARALASAAGALPAARNYRDRCKALVTEACRLSRMEPDAPSPDEAWRAAAGATDVAIAAPRGPPH
ncbi:hypothetical protein [Phenylobacterium sp.]|uniref:hypothetical protein n=1 Tax=Phenylobacterium sp. TaxID=1871053 RepID=UPI0025D53A96|nr:hypothetical protein [Phenylobacterium sp.]